MSLRHVVILAGVWLLSTLGAVARVQETCTYSKVQVFQSALRFIRVDNGYAVVEKDEGAGYLLFEYPTGDGPETTPGSVEVIEHASEVQFVVKIPKLAEHHERLLVRRFLEKLQSEYGDPPERKPAPDKTPKKGDSDEAEDDEKDEGDDDAKPEVPKAPPPSRSKARRE